MVHRSEDQGKRKVMTMPADGDQWTTTGQGGTRQNVVVASDCPTLTKFRCTRKGRERVNRQMAPLKARIWSKMAEDRGETAQRIQNLNGFSDLMTGRENRRGVRPPAACIEHVVDTAAELVRRVAHCCSQKPQKDRLQTRRAEQARSAGP